MTGTWCLHVLGLLLQASHPQNPRPPKNPVLLGPRSWWWGHPTRWPVVGGRTLLQQPPPGRSPSCLTLPVPGAGGRESLHPNPGRGGHHRQEGHAHQAAGAVCGSLHQGNASLSTASVSHPLPPPPPMSLLSGPRMAVPMPSRDRVPPGIGTSRLQNFPARSRPFLVQLTTALGKIFRAEEPPSSPWVTSVCP